MLGHGLCGGVKALLEGSPPSASEFVAPWMSMAESARILALNSPPEERQLRCEYEVVKVSLANLMTFPWIAEGVHSGKDFASRRVVSGSTAVRSWCFGLMARFQAPA